MRRADDHACTGTAKPEPRPSAARVLNPLHRGSARRPALLPDPLRRSCTCVVFAVDGGPWTGRSPGASRCTFGLSFGLTLHRGRPGHVVRARRTALRTALLGVFAADCVRGGRRASPSRRGAGVPSHLDMETPLRHGGVHDARGRAAASSVVLLTVFAGRPPSGTGRRARPGWPLAVRSGFAILLVALASGAAMIARGVVLTRTGHQEAAYHSTAPLKPLHGVEPARRPGAARAGLAAVPHALERDRAAADRGRGGRLLRGGRRRGRGVGPSSRT